MDNPVRVSQAAEIYGCDRRRIYQLIDEGRLKSTQLYGLTLVDASEVKRLSEEITPRGTPRKKS